MTGASALSKAEFQEITRAKWKDGTYVEQVEVGAVKLPASDHLAWVKHECMRAKLVRVTPGEVGELLLKFPPNGHEDLEMHSHPVSDRVITVLAGGGVFRALRDGVEVEHVLRPGDVVYMPRGTFHTFLGDAEPLMVHALHNPWVPMDHEDNIRYPDGSTSRHYDDWDGAASVHKSRVPEALMAPAGAACPAEAPVPRS